MTKCAYTGPFHISNPDVTTFAEHVIRQEMKSAQMTSADWNSFTLEFMSTFCPENEATTALM
jgi:hypothetical protein